ncbi:conserved hypothetical protein [Thioalkalivibrio sulfidiphilus HL-EbGr7]|uniref:Uncharacterized protein n=1 Tax=Thioalkalivibrio sulfidiphilus (strain HL-EbGR7) TaxID=396588 RepID=B8GMQ2_THISH|nr:putative DNA-binding domain-containing protein [Thioalkalivibrio sulfidiphilus]ACL73717.1 conserved hypothetical protein [Thioalkalivibrio sulfidiphilus HL-EbGr7]
MSEPRFQQLQRALTAHLRDPEGHPPPEVVEERRIRVYRELIYNNVEGFLRNGFPVIRSLYDDTSWHALVRDFLRSHRAHTPYFLEIGREFVAWLQDVRTSQGEDPPFLAELAHYEYMEVALSVAEAPPDWVPAAEQDDLLEIRPTLSPLAWLLGYRFPVHRIGADHRPEQASQTPHHLLVHRTPQDGIAFLELNPVTAHLVYLIQNNQDRTARSLLEQITGELGHADPQVVIQGGLEILEELRGREVLGRMNGSGK